MKDPEVFGIVPHNDRIEGDPRGLKRASFSGGHSGRLITRRAFEDTTEGRDALLEQAVEESAQVHLPAGILEARRDKK